jgi:hypothetical protein
MTGRTGIENVDRVHGKNLRDGRQKNSPDLKPSRKADSHLPLQQHSNRRNA